MRCSVKARDMRPRAWVAMKLIASAVARSAATKRSPSFSRSSSSTRIIIRPLRTSGRTRSTMDSLVEVIFVTGRPSIAALGNQTHELGARPVLLKFARECGCSCDRMLLLNAAHDHAHVLRLEHHCHAQRFQGLVNTITDLDRQPFLYLQATSESVNYARNLREPDDVSVGNIRDMRLAEKRQHMMFAQGVDLDILDDHHLLVLFLEHRRTQDGGRIEIFAVGQK